METDPGYNPENKAEYVTPEERLAWLMEFGYELKVITEMTGQRKKTVRNWIQESDEIDEESADRINSLFIYSRAMEANGAYDASDIIGMAKTKYQS